ncbi:MAG: hypothetical protein ACXWTS_01950 [Methylococcaceae bacterium]
MQQRFYRAITIQGICSTIIFLLYGVFAFFPGIALAVSGHEGHVFANRPKWLFGDLLFFPDVTTVSHFDHEPASSLHDNEIIPAINLFYTVDYKQFRFLGEWFLNTKTHNLERLQLGWHLGESSLWLGRFHNPIGYWNMQYHHAAFLQTTVSRPGIMAFETAGGVIPNHLTGFLFEGIHELDKAGLYYTLGVGAGPDLTTGLDAFNIIEPHGSHRPGVSFRLGYQPISYGTDEIGLSAAYTEIPSDRTDVNEVKQVVAGIYGNRQFDNYRILSEVVYVHNWLELSLAANETSDFLNAYGQLEWDFQQDWTLFGRLEGTLGAHNDPYLVMFPKFVENRFMGGIRYKLNHNMALKLEASQDHVRNDSYGQVMVQWSAIFP